jgi:hypothetical protein
MRRRDVLDARFIKPFGAVAVWNATERKIRGDKTTVAEL